MTAEPPGSVHRDVTRVSDEEREEVLERVKGAVADGRIDFAELDAKVGRALAARTRADLHDVTADLPPVVPADPGQPLLLKGGYHGVKRAGPWQVPTRVTAYGGTGGVTLDFTQAVCRRPVVDVEVHGELAGVTIVIPESWGADTDAVDADFGGLRDKTSPERLPGTTLIRLTGTGGMAGVVIRHPNGRERRRLRRKRPR
ncbi:DUF1707 domain-containing protein [Streptomyces finlayi]|uniref:DUF1707 domain-containing protein n=1 Tax=Streptomyces finlayi TaxID=67296 RepID=A0A7G7BDB1_9ACTN|nr:DUF1707 domain-containing protein [Streptomyces finlayi]QNE73326.1 DUF1707 domain-containing protein [Streptomyces finlayi]